MVMRIRCPSCRRGLLAREQAVGRRRTCPACRTKITVPAPAPEPVQGMSEVVIGALCGVLLGLFGEPIVVFVGTALYGPYANDPGWSGERGLASFLVIASVVLAPVAGAVGGFVGAYLGGCQGGFWSKQ